ncbi:hypothetical protein BaRGS_00008114 [Batillaria attramentaria]|uniref:Uncharacterized protein n=1 Tax=Batillaria attramentaria TaxID=370345 RepID=A0ABD0LLU4_9CAEN
MEQVRKQSRVWAQMLDQSRVGGQKRWKPLSSGEFEKLDRSEVGEGKIRIGTKPRNKIGLQREGVTRGQNYTGELGLRRVP